MIDNNALAAEMVAALDRQGERLAGLLGDLIASESDAATVPADTLDDPPDSDPMTITPTRCAECEQLIPPNIGHIFTGRSHMCLRCARATQPGVEDGEAA